MALTLIARIKAKPGSEKELENAFRDMIKKVRAAEPGCLTYVLHKSNEDPTTFVWYETYTDDAAFATHRKTDHMKEMGARIANLLAEKPQIVGITLPGMPEGTPGMPGAKPGPLDIYVIGTAKAKVYATL